MIDNGNETKSELTDAEKLKIRFEVCSSSHKAQKPEKAKNTHLNLDKYKNLFKSMNSLKK